eukprot:COSAG06_NODE_4500_length_4201_cov_2.081911_1_plen_180_part_10
MVANGHTGQKVCTYDCGIVPQHAANNVLVRHSLRCTCDTRLNFGLLHVCECCRFISMLIMLAALIGQIAASPYTTRSLNLIEFTSLLFTVMIMICGMSFRVQSTEALNQLSQAGMFELESSTDVLNTTLGCDGGLDRSSGLAECKLEHESDLWKRLQYFCIFLVVLMTALSLAVAAENSR